MKKFVSAICLLLCATGLAVLCAGCSMAKTPLTVNDFTAKMEEKGYEIEEIVIDSLRVKSAKCAIGDEFNVEFYLLSDVATAAEIYANRTEKAQSVGTGSYYTKEGENYKTFSGTYEGEYYYVAYVDNTLLYIQAEKTQKDAVKDIVDMFKY